MKKLLIVCPYPHGKAASQRFRFEQYLEYLPEWGIDCHQKSFWANKHWPAIYKKGNLLRKIYATLRGFADRFSLLFQLRKYDLIFIHREATPLGWPWWEWAAANIWKKKIIFDFDDAIWLPNSSLANNALIGGLKAHSKTKKILSWSGLSFAGNAFLATYAANFCDQTQLVPTTIDTYKLHNPNLFPPCENTIPVVGWTGTHSTLKQLIPLFPILETVHAEQPFVLEIIADQPPANMPAFAQFRPWKKETEIEDLMRFDIGIMPLYDTDWERGKCGFKALQYMALGIPAVVSAVGVNSEIVLHGQAGFVAEAMPNNDGIAWSNALFNLLRDQELRKEIGEKGRARVEAHFSVNAFRETYRSALFTYLDQGDTF